MLANNRREIVIGAGVVAVVVAWILWARWDQTPAADRILVMSRIMGFYFLCGAPFIWLGVGWTLRAWLRPGSKPQDL
jgi:hypothetical protein